MPKAGTITPRVQRILERVRREQSTREISKAEGVTVRAVNDIRLRYGLQGSVGRQRDPNKRRYNRRVPTLPLTDVGISRVEDHLIFARRVARLVWRAKDAPIDELEEYESCAFLGLVRAASRFQRDGRASFKTYARHYIEGEISRHRILAMRCDGWAFKDWRRSGMIRGGQRVEWPTLQETGEQVDIAGNINESSVARMAERVGVTVPATSEQGQS